MSHLSRLCILSTLFLVNNAYSQETSPESVNLNLDREGFVHVPSEESIEPLDEEQSRAQVISLLGREPATPVVISVDSRAPNREVIALLDWLKDVGARSIALVSSDEEDSAPLEL